MTTAAYALLGAIAGMLAIYLGLRFHLGQTVIDGVPAYIGAAIAGAVGALVVRYAVRKTLGPIVP